MTKNEVYVIVDTPKKDDYCTIQLTKGKYTIVDSDDFDILNRYNWHYQSRGYACNEKLGLLHRFITNCPKGMVVDHINGDKLDNRKENLRICSQIQNTFNSKGVDNKTSKYKGVSWTKNKNKWKAQIHINKKNTYLGLFDSEIEAAKKYDEIAYYLYGDFAKLNFKRYATKEEIKPKELEVGKWYLFIGHKVADKPLMLITENNGSCVRFCGFNFLGKWVDNDLYTLEDLKRYGYTEATPQEVEEALIKEAKRRYKVGDRLKDVNGVEIVPNGWYVFKEGVLYYGGATLMKNGKWAEVVDKFAELKEAHKNGAVIQYKIGNGNWIDCKYPAWSGGLVEYRIKPEERIKIGDVVKLNSTQVALVSNQQEAYRWRFCTKLTQQEAIDLLFNNGGN